MTEKTFFTQLLENMKNRKFLVGTIVLHLIIITSFLFFYDSLRPFESEIFCKNRILELESEIQALTEGTEIQQKNLPANTNLSFPAIVYSREGLLTMDKNGFQEKKRLEEKFIQPYIDYHNEDKIYLIALHITVPTEMGSPYEISAIFNSPNRPGIAEFNFGVRGEDYDYWYPECMDGCDFSETFKKKYPMITNSR